MIREQMGYPPDTEHTRVISLAEAVELAEQCERERVARVEPSPGERLAVSGFHDRLTSTISANCGGARSMVIGLVFLCFVAYNLELTCGFIGTLNDES